MGRFPEGRTAVTEIYFENEEGRKWLDENDLTEIKLRFGLERRGRDDILDRDDFSLFQLQPFALWPKECIEGLDIDIDSDEDDESELGRWIDWQSQRERVFIKVVSLVNFWKAIFGFELLGTYFSVSQGQGLSCIKE
jgi:hypothetical protein